MKPSKETAFIAMGLALLITLSQISIPIGVIPLTLQTFAVALIASLYKPKAAMTITGLYLLLGAIGLPVFAGFSGGFAALIGPTAGFLWGFLAFSGVTASLTHSDSKPWTVFLAALVGDAICFVAGCIFFKYNLGVDWGQSISLTILPFLFHEGIKLLLVSLIHKGLQPVLKKEAYFNK
ncbi:TPA: biotin transporter BioY [Streptococcus suis]